MNNMKKIINNPNNVVEEAMEGMCKAFPDLIKRVKDTRVITKKTVDNTKVNIISGGGSGHEPAHAGYVGDGMLDAAVCGDVFTSPTPDQIFEAIKEVKSDRGVLLIVKNYTGDIMNFDMAKDMAEMEDINVETVVVNDDVAVEDSLYTTGRRGVAGTVLVEKVAGAKAKQGANLVDVKKVAEKAIHNTRSMGVALSSCTVPSSGKPNFELADDEMEMGIGIHGEPGIRKEKLKTAKEIAIEMVDNILKDLDFGKEVALMVNGLGGTPLSEQFIIANDVIDYLETKKIKVFKSYVGNYMTSLEMNGISITLMKIDDELKSLLLEKANTIAFKE